MKVLALPAAIEYLENLTTILHEKGYFGFEEYAINYVNELIDEINTKLPVCIHKPAPKYFKKYGKDLEYMSFSKSKHTTWYVFFEVYEDNEEIVYLIKHIENNHTAAQYFSL